VRERSKRREEKEKKEKKKTHVPSSWISGGKAFFICSTSERMDDMAMHMAVLRSVAPSSSRSGDTVTALIRSAACCSCTRATREGSEANSRALVISVQQRVK
jgi:hypothetical protein